MIKIPAAGTVVISSIASILIVTLVFTTGCNTSRISKSEVDGYFSDLPVNPSYKQERINGRTVSYIVAGNKKMPTVLFLHGAPGSIKSFIHFFKDTVLTNKAYLIAVDRPGYGYSGYGESVVSLEKQAQLLKPILSNGKKPVILVGHSLGGPVAARIAMDYPKIVDALILIAPAIDPDLEPTESWFRWPLSATLLRNALPPVLRTANDEIYYLKDELIKMVPLWRNIQIPVTVIQGKKDVRVPPGNAQFAKEMLTNATDVDIILRDDLNHFVPWEQPELIKTTIYKYLSLLKE